MTHYRRVMSVLTFWLQRSLDLEQLLLDCQAAGITTEAAASCDNAVARDDDRDRIAAQGLSDGTAGPGLSDAPGQLAIGRYLTRRNVARRRQHASLEGRNNTQVYRQLEGRATAVEVFLELGDDAGHSLGRLNRVELQSLAELCPKCMLALHE